MIEYQLVQRGIQEPRVIAAFRSVERHEFVPDAMRSDAYNDHPLPIGEGQTISQPYIVALMTEALELTGTERVLEIGTGSGYQTAILAKLAKTVYTIERIESLAEQALETLARMGFINIRVKIGDGTLGWEEEAPFDRIIITAAAPAIPAPLEEQLAESGIIILPEGPAYFAQTLIKADKHNGILRRKDLGGCVFVPLIGKYGEK